MSPSVKSSGLRLLARSAMCLIGPIALAFETGPALAQAVTATPANGHPTASISISGKSFANLEAIDVYVDTTDTILLVSSATGTFTGSVTIPATASPGTHYITAIGRRSGDAAQVTLSVTTPWTEFGFGGAHLNWNPYENTLNSDNVPFLGPIWQVPTNTGIGSSPAVVGGHVIVATAGGQGVEALKASTGAVVWSVLPSVVFKSSPAVVNGVVYIGAANANVMYALKAATGATIWSTPTTGTFSGNGAIVAGGVVYAGGGDNNIYAFQASTGQILWKHATGGYITSSPAVVNGVVYIGSDDSYVYAVYCTQRAAFLFPGGRRDDDRSS
jgi:outer membrane protein assembly factor BamB